MKKKTIFIGITLFAVWMGAVYEESYASNLPVHLAQSGSNFKEDMDKSAEELKKAANRVEKKAKRNMQKRKMEKRSSKSKEKASRSNTIVNVNTATVEELTQLNGVGKKLAKNIVAYREKNGEFHDLYEFRRVRGLKGNIIRKNINNVTFH